MGLGVSSDDGIPEIDSSVRSFIEQVTGRCEVVIDCIKPDDFSCVEWVMEKAGLD